MVALFFGLLAGTLHVLSGPDHLAAVAPLSVRRRGWQAGFVWGVGHTSGVWVVGCLAYFTQYLLPLHAMASWSDRLAAAALVLLGLWTLAGLVRGRRRRQPRVGMLLRAASLFGVLHGLAGSSHYLGILPAFAFPTVEASALYLFGFGVSTVAVMSACAWGLGRATVLPRLVPVLRGLSGVAAVVVGTAWMIA